MHRLRHRGPAARLIASCGLAASIQAASIPAASMLATAGAQAAPAGFSSLCSGLGVTLPRLTAVPLNTVLPGVNSVVGDVNANLVQALDGKQLTVGIYDPASNSFVSVPAGSCNLALDGLKVDNAAGIAIGGGEMLGLGGSGNIPASAGDGSAIAFGNGAATGPGVTNALALGTGASVGAAESVALGAGSVADRGAGSYTAFGLKGTETAAGEVSLGRAGALRQVTNLAAGAADTDAVNLMQLRGTATQLGASASAALGGGALYSTVDATLSLPSFRIRGTTYTNVGDALAAVDLALGTTANAGSGTGVTGTSGSGVGGSGTGTTASSGSGTAGTGTTSPGTGTGVTAGGAVLYDRAANGSTIASVSLASDQGGPVVIHNLAPGIAANDAATVGQMQAVANASVQYTTVNGVRSNTVLLTGGAPGGVTIGNLAPGHLGTDAVNLNQLRDYATSMRADANAYTDNAVSNLRALTAREIASARRDAAGGTALALAATGLHYDDRPGKVSVGGATAYYHGQMGIAAGIAATSESGRVRVNAALSASPTIDHPDVGGVIGASIAIN